MNRLIILAIASTATGVLELTHGLAADPPVNLQASTPGVAQVGHVNVTGTILAGTFFGESGGATTKVVSGWATSPTGYVFGGDFRTASVDGRGVFASATATTGFNYGGDFRSASVDGRGIFGFATNVNGQGIGGDFRSDSPYGTGVVGRVNSATGVPIGVYGEAPSNGFAGSFNGKVRATSFSGNGAGLTNVDAATVGGFPASNFLQHVPSPLSLFSAVSGPVIYGENDLDSGSPIGVRAVCLGLNASSHAIDGKTYSANGIAVYGYGFASSGSTYGVLGQVNSPSGHGLFGEGLASSGSSYGVVGVTHSTTGYGVFGGVSGVSGGNFAIYGSNSGGGYAVYAAGNSGASGTKSFRIDHPLDPANKYLLHYSTESPSPQNFYSGNITTDNKGYAWVALPDYFMEINANFKYQLTVLKDGDTFVQAMVSKKIVANRFQVHTSAPNTEVSWRVEADRNDRWVQKQRPRDVVPKEGAERGKYQQPELYGYGPEMRTVQEPNSGHNVGPAAPSEDLRKR